jgi:bacillithiol biosynthesis cysteine-adding enzyme BshC
VSATATTSLEILPATLDSSALVRDYLARQPALAPFFAGHPADAEAYQRKANAIARRQGHARLAQLAPALRPLSGPAAAKLERISAGEGFLVTTGQQAGLFGGPLYTIHKTLSALRLAETLEALLDRPVLALFWVAADDHDWAEVDHTWLLDRSGALQRITLGQPADTPPHSMADRLLGTDAEHAITALAGALPETEFSAWVIDAARQAYRPDASVARAFEDLMAMLFRDHDLLLMSGAHPAVKEAARPTFLREIRNADAHAELLARQTAKLEKAGYHAQVQVGSDAANLFLHDARGRERLVREAGAWMLRRTKRRMSDAELEAMVQATPGSFSANVLLRPVLESTLLPTLAYIGGPSEVGYFAQIGCLFRAHDIEAPLVFPRFRITLVEGRVRRVLEKFGLDVASFKQPLHEITANMVRDDLPPEITKAAEVIRNALHNGYDEMSRAAIEIDPTLEGWLSKQRNAALNSVEDAERKVTSHLRKRKETELAQLERAAAALSPEGTPQERVLNVLPFLARYGPDLLRDMKTALQVELGPVSQGWDGVQCDD